MPDAHHSGCDVRFYPRRPLCPTRAENAADLRCKTARVGRRTRASAWRQCDDHGRSSRDAPGHLPHSRPRRSKNRSDGRSTIALALSAIVVLRRKDATSRFCSRVRKYQGKRNSSSRSAFEEIDLPIATTSVRPDAAPIHLALAVRNLKRLKETVVRYSFE